MPYLLCETNKLHLLKVAPTLPLGPESEQRHISKICVCSRVCAACTNTQTQLKWHGFHFGRFCLNHSLIAGVIPITGQFTCSPPWAPTSHKLTAPHVWGSQRKRWLWLHISELNKSPTCSPPSSKHNWNCFLINTDHGGLHPKISYACCAECLVVLGEWVTCIFCHICQLLCSAVGDDSNDQTRQKIRSIST